MDYVALRGKSPDEIIDAASQDSGVPAQVLKNLWGVESNFGQNMLSPAGAMGHTQIMPKTLKTMRQRYGEDLDPHNLADSMYMTSQLLKENLQHFGNLPDALRAYNGGWDKSKWGNKETSAYAGKILDGTGINTADAFTTARNEMLPEIVEGVGTTQKAKLADQEKAAIYQQQLTAMLSTGSQDVATQVGTALSTNPQAAFDVALSAGNQPPAGDYTDADANLLNAVLGDRETASRIANRTNSETFDAAFQQVALTSAIYDEMARMKAIGIDNLRRVDYEYQGDYKQNREERIRGLSPAAVMQMDRAINQQEANWIAEQDATNQKAQQVLNDSEHPILWSLAAGITDPASWAVGFGAGKVLNVGKSMALSERVAKLAGSNAIANVGIMGGLDAMGRNVTAEDYVHAAAFGLATGAALGAIPAIWGAVKAPPPGGTPPLPPNPLGNAARQAHQRGAHMAEEDLRAAQQAYPNATPEELAAHAKEISIRRVEQTVLDNQFDPAPSSRLFNQNNVLSPSEVGSFQAKYSFDSVVDEEQLMSYGGLMKTSENWLVQNNALLNKTRMKSHKNRAVSDALGWRSVGNELINDDNPLAQVLGMNAAEDAAGISGFRGTTVSIKSKLIHNQFNHNIDNGFNENYMSWLNERGVGRASGALETYTTGRRLKEFSEAVFDEIEARGRPGYTQNASAYVRQAANMLERGYATMGARQKSAGTLGNEFIPDSPVGYQPHQLDPTAIRGLSANEKRVVMAEYQRQATQELGWDAEFAQKLVSQYVNRAEDYAFGRSGFNPAAPKGLIEHAMDELNASGVTGPEYIARLEQLRKGAGKHTNRRIDWDLSARITLDNGHTVPLSSLYVKDVLSLYRGYSNRVSGDVAMAHIGIMGDRDIKLITEALTRSKVGNPERTVPAWQQLVNEIYNRPTAADTSSKFAQGARFLRQYTSLRLLGGVGFMQMGEMANTFAHLGLQHTLNVFTKFPRMFGEVTLARQGIVPNNPILASLDTVAGSPLGAEQYAKILPQVIDDGLTITDTRSINNVMRVMGGGQLLHSKFSFMRRILAMQNRVVSEEIVSKAMRFIREGGEDAALRDMGITPQLAAKMRAELPNIAAFNEKGYLQALDVRNMADKAALEEFLIATRRGTGQIIQDTFPGETGKWMRSEMGQLLMQFRKFPSVAVEKQMYRQFGNLGYAKAFAGSMMMMAWGGMIYFGRSQVKAALLGDKDRKEYLDKALDPTNWAMGAMMYVGNFGMATDFLQMGTGMANLLGESTGIGAVQGRHGGTGIGSLIPSLGTLDDAYGLIKDPSTDAALKMLPFTTLPLVQPMYQHLRALDNED